MPEAPTPEAVRDRVRKQARRAVAGFYPSTSRPAAPWEAKRAAPDYGARAEPSWRDIDWPTLLKRTKVGDDEVAYVDLGSGEGPPLVFIHGLAGKWQNWLENLPRAAQERRAIALDLPGFGESPMPHERISISYYARRVDRLLDQLGVDTAVLVGNSMGGFVACQVALDHPARVDRLVLAASAGISVTNLRRRPTLTGARVAGAISAFTLARREAVIARPRARHAAMSFVIRHPSLMAADLLLEIAPESNAPGFMDGMEALLDYDDRERLPQIQAATLLVWGEEDMLVPATDADEFERLLPDCRKVVLEETGHVPMLERPRTFNDLLMDFVGEGRGEETPGEDEVQSRDAARLGAAPDGGERREAEPGGGAGEPSDAGEPEPASA
jgi:pimeloyl-ACP methyl ester carboxylesterase